MDRPPWPPLSGAGGATEGRLPPELDPRLHRPSDFQIFAIVAVVVIVVVLLPAVYYTVTHTGGGASGNSGGTPPPTPIGSVFAVGLLAPLTCTSSLVALNACVTVGDSLDELQVETSTVIFGEVLFHVQDRNGTIFGNPGIGSFALVTAAGEAAAYSDLSAHAGLAMLTTWAHYAAGYSSASLLTSASLTISVDLGQTTPGTGLYFVAVGINGCTGTTAPLSLG